MKTLTLTQPWATLVAIGAKRVETRSWETLYRGPLAIHAAKGFPRDCKDLCRDDPFFTELTKTGFEKRPACIETEDPETWPEVDLDRLPRGMIVATCELIACRRITPMRLDIPVPDASCELAFGDYTPGRFAWVLDKIKPLDKPIPAKGALGLWNCEFPR